MIMITSAGLLLALLLPLLAPLLLLARPGRRALWLLLPWLPLPALLLALFGETSIRLPLPWVLLGSELAMDGLRRPFLLLAALLWILAGGYARHYLAPNQSRERFALLWSLTLSGNLALILAQDVASFYTGFALMTFAGYGLVIHSGSEQARFAGRIYLLLAVIGEALMLAGLVLAVVAADSLQLAALPEAVANSERQTLTLLCLLGGFGVKAGLPLLHVWLPLAHPVAPTPASAVLSGVMIKAGLLGWLLTLPLGYAVPAVWGQTLLAMGLLAAFAAAAIGITQNDPKTVLAYSSVSQMGLLTLCLGAILLEPGLAAALLPVIPLFVLHHGLAKGALFLAVGPAQGRQPHWKTALAVLPGLALIGLPLTSGYAIKQALKQSLYDGPKEFLLLAQLPLLLALASAATSLLIWRYYRCLRSSTAKSSASGLQRWWLSSAAVSILLGLLLLRPWPGLPPQSYGLAAIWASGWPLLLAAALIALQRWQRRPGPTIPAGDVLWLVLPLARLLRDRYAPLITILSHRQQQCGQYLRSKVDRLLRAEQAFLDTEILLRRHSALLFVLLLALAWWLF